MPNLRRKAIPPDDLTEARERRSAEQLAYRAEVLECLSIPRFPDQLMDQITHEPTITGEGEEQVRRLFRSVGITNLDPLSKDFDTVLNTWSVLIGKGVGKQLRALSRLAPSSTTFKPLTGILLSKRTSMPCGLAMLARS